MDKRVVSNFWVKMLVEADDWIWVLRFLEKALVLDVNGNHEQGIGGQEHREDRSVIFCIILLSFLCLVLHFHYFLFFSVIPAQAQ